MPVYVDDMRAKVGNMIMCHMMADSTEELLAMAKTIGVNVRWIQTPGTATEHFDICLSKRANAVAAGAKEVTQRDIGLIVRARREQQTKG